MKQKNVVIKVGGAILDNNEALSRIIPDIKHVFSAGYSVIFVHGGSKQIDNEMKLRDIPIKKIEGKRYTDQLTINVLDKCCGELNIELVNLFKKTGVSAMGLHGKSNIYMFAEKLQSSVDLGMVGSITEIDEPKLSELLNNNIAVVSPLAASRSGQLYNINADEVAEKIAVSLQSGKLILVTDVDGIYIEKSGEKEVIRQLTVTEAKQLVNSGYISGGMIPKLNSCINVVQQGISSIHIVNGNTKNIINDVIKGVSAGTRIVK
jgi:acetylglutamate kinase